MKKVNLLQCFDITDAVQNGIDDFNRLSGCNSTPAKAFIKPDIEQMNKSEKILSVMLLAIIIKFFK